MLDRIMHSVLFWKRTLVIAACVFAATIVGRFAVLLQMYSLAGKSSINGSSSSRASETLTGLDIWIRILSISSYVSTIALVVAGVMVYRLYKKK